MVSDFTRKINFAPGNSEGLELCGKASAHHELHPFHTTLILNFLFKALVAVKLIDRRKSVLC